MTPDIEPTFLALPDFSRAGVVPLCLALMMILSSCQNPRRVEVPGPPADASEVSSRNHNGWFMSPVGGHGGGDMPSGPRVWEPGRDVDPGEVMGGETMFEWTRYPDRVEPTEEEKMRAETLRQQSFAAAVRNGWFDFEKASADGYYPMFSSPDHYARDEFVTDDSVLDPERPEFLLFYDTDKGPRLVAAMYLSPKQDEHGPQIGGPLTLWHSHTLASPVCFKFDLIFESSPDEDGACSDGIPRYDSPEMLHVWFIDHPLGPFATDMELPEGTRAEFEGPNWPPTRIR